VKEIGRLCSLRGQVDAQGSTPKEADPASENEVLVDDVQLGAQGRQGEVGPGDVLDLE
jgi:hypothetical protein